MYRFWTSLLCVATLCTAQSAAWGTKGHTIINSVAADALAGRVPAFLSTPFARAEIGYLGPQMDRLKGSGRSWDADYDPGHYLDVLDDGTVAGGVTLTNLPVSREAYDTALRAAGTDQYKRGFLPYSILDGWEQLRSDFAYWRADAYAAQHAHTAQLRSASANAQQIDQQLVLADLGEWGHFVGDASQPLHVSVHFNGWGDYPNPNGYTQSHETHSFFESGFVNKYVSRRDVAAMMQSMSALPQPEALLSQEQILADIAVYLHATLATVPQLYDIEKAGGFASGSPQAKTFAASRLAAGAIELRDLVALAWQDSIHARVGYPASSVQEILSGKAAWPQGD